MSVSPSVSVLLPVRNAQRTLGETLRSIQAQTLKGFEVVAIDDHCEDQSTEIFAEFAHQDGRFRLIKNTGRGLVAALNTGLKACQGPLVARMDADDLMHRDRLRLQSQALTARPDLTLLACQVRLFPEEQIQAGYREYIRWQNACLTPSEIGHNIFVESPLAHPSVMFRRQSVINLGGYCEGDFPEDYDLWLRLHAAGYAMAKLPVVLLDWRESADRASRIDPRYARDAFDRLRARYLAEHLGKGSGQSDPSLTPGPRPIVVWGAGRRTRQRVRLLSDQGLLVSGFIDIDPKKIARCYQGVEVHPPQWLEQWLEPCLEQGEKPMVLIYVTNHGARDEIAAYLETLQYLCGRDFLAVG